MARFKYLAMPRYMKSIDIKYNGRIYHYSHILGLLISSKKKTNPNESLLNKKERNAFKLIENPFLLKPNTDKLENDTFFIYGKVYVKLLIWSYYNFYPLLYLLSYLRLNIFSNSKEAINYFCKIHPTEQNRLCLPRSIFAITTSKRFNKKGVMFIGVFLPSKHMHAWILEDDENPYKSDKIWTNFSPVAIIS